MEGGLGDPSTDGLTREGEVEVVAHSTGNSYTTKGRIRNLGLLDHS